ncbi:MAG: alpha-galactosidase, partial [Gemmatimonadetes bacterium]|nr:alpha-galactosidase [Gemmatimonadota bacterium]
LPVTLSGEMGTFRATVSVDALAPGVEVARVRLASDEPAAPPALSLRWSLPSRDIRGQWTTAAGMDKTLDPDWGPSEVRSALARQAPVLALFGSDDGNRLTFAVSDALNGSRLHAAVREEDARIYGGVDLCTARHRAVTSVEVEIRFDVRPVPLARARSDVSAWWAAKPGYAPAAVPEAGRLPMYSTWYSYHQSVSPESLLPEVETARALGYDAIIVDDGWQTLDSQRGYAFTGDWRPERIPDMKGFVDAVHRRGMKFILWYAVPLVGERSEAFRRFQGKFLREWKGQGAWEIDPRYPDVREYILGTYRDAIREWDVDGCKLDFLERLAADASTVLELGDGRDYASVNEAADRLMTDILAEMRKVKPDVLIEFRQPYIGPKLRTYGNLFRAGDAPNSTVANRVRVVDLRLLSGSTAVHSDMLMWSLDEPVEQAALQLLAIELAVPQLSVRLAELPPEHLAMVRHYTTWWRENREVLLDGAFEPRAPLSNYPLVMARTERKRIAAAYAPITVPVEGVPEAVDVLNASGHERLVLDAPTPLGPYGYRVLDALGAVREQGDVTLDGPRAFAVPVGGMGALERVR